MRKMLLTTFGVFVLCLVTNIEPDAPSIEKKALADGTCCPNQWSVCGINDFFIVHYYEKSNGGSCKEKVEQFFE